MGTLFNLNYAQLWAHLRPEVVSRFDVGLGSTLLNSILIRAKLLEKSCRAGSDAAKSLHEPLKQSSFWILIAIADPTPGVLPDLGRYEEKTQSCRDRTSYS